MADLDQAYGNIFDNNKKTRQISHFFTQRKITESIDGLNPKTLARTKKDINFVNNYLALVLPKDENSPKLIIEIYGNNGYCFQGEINSYTENTPHLLIPLQDDKEIFINIYDYKKDKDGTIKEKQSKYVSFIHIPKRYQSTEDIEETTELSSLKTKDIKVDL